MLIPHTPHIEIQGGLVEAAHMAQQYISYMVAKAQNMQNNKLSLIQELGHLQLAQAKHEKQSKLHEEKPYILEYKVREEASNKFEAMKKLKLEQGNLVGYQLKFQILIKTLKGWRQRAPTKQIDSNGKLKQI